MPDIRVALFTGNYNHIKDGVSLTLNRLIRYLEKQGIESVVFGPTIPEPAISHAGKFMPVPSIGMPGRSEYRISILLPEAMKLDLDAFNPTLIHIATPDILGLRALLYARKRNIPVITSYHTHFPSYLKYYDMGYLEPLMWWYLKWFYGKCDRIVVPSTSMIKWLKDRGLKTSVGLWSRGVNTFLFNPEKRDMKWREEQGIKADEVVVTFVSRVVWEKNLKTLIQTMKIVREKSKKIRLMITGDGPALPDIKSELPGAIFTGHQTGENLAKIYASSDIFFFPSETETFGNVTLEAASSGLPGIVADAIGSKSIVIDGETGYWCPPYDSAKFAEIIIKLADDPALRNQMSQRAREEALKYRWDIIMERLVMDYSDLIQNKS